MKSRAQGFTLVEVMVSLAILSLVMLVTVSGFRTLGNTATSISAMTGRTDELRSVSMFLRDAFENSVGGKNVNNKRELTFGGAGSGGLKFCLERPMEARTFFVWHDRATVWCCSGRSLKTNSNRTNGPISHNGWS